LISRELRGGFIEDLVVEEENGCTEKGLRDGQQVKEHKVYIKIIG